ncbi:MAG: exopolysaccharide biosynthesis polyprenyl glycosylphosphotransferase [Acidimicrobiia bacterium]
MAIEAPFGTPAGSNAPSGGVAVSARRRWLRAAPDRRSTPPWRASALIATGDTAALVLALVVTSAWNVAGVAYAVVALGVLALSGEYRRRLTLSALNEAPRLAGRLAAPMLLAGPLALATSVGASFLWVPLTAAVVLVFYRILTYAVIRRGRRRGQAVTNTVVLGAGHVGSEVVEILRAHPEYGLTPLGFLDQVDDTNLPVPLLGDIAELETVLKTIDVQALIVAFGPTREADLVGVMRMAVQYNVEVYVVPRFFDVGVAPEGPDTDDVWGIPLYRVRRAALRTGAWAAKRAMDVVVSGLLLLVASPVLGLIALWVRLTSPGPVLFRQKRIGQHAQEFELLKFRTMRVSEDSDTEWQPDAERITRIGRFLRKTSLDELPQLWNVLRGDMSLVGARPERPHFVHEFGGAITGYGDRHRLPVGMTGWAQVHGLRGDTSIEERVRFDNQYIEHWSPWRDTVILARTAAEVLRSSEQRRRKES